MTELDPTVSEETLPEGVEVLEGENTETPLPSAEEGVGSKPHTHERGRRGRDDRGGDRGKGRGPRKEEEPKEFAEELLGVDRVTRVTAGGRQLRFRASVVIGNGKGTIGFGTGKAGEVQGAIEKAVHDAKKHLVHFPIVSGTIPHDVTVNFKSSSLFIHPARPGTGIIAGGAVRKVFAVSGLKDIIAKQHGAPNKITNAQVAILALQALKPESANNSFVKKQQGVPVQSESTEDQTKETPLKHDHTEKKTKLATPKKSAGTPTTNQ